MHCRLLRRRVAALGRCPEYRQGRLHAGHGQHLLRVVQPEGHREVDASLPPLGRVRYFCGGDFPRATFGFGVLLLSTTLKKENPLWYSQVDFMP